jgi:hypothetical protein
MLHDPLDGPILSGCVASLQQDQNLIAAADEVALQCDQFDLECPETPFVFLFTGLPLP